MTDIGEIPYRYDVTARSGEVQARFSELETGGRSGVIVSVAGRVMRLRVQGRAVFGDLRDSSGTLQLFGRAEVTERFEALCRLRLGDWIGATGEVVRTRRGELSVEVTAFELLAEARRSFGDKWRGIADPELRYRQREVDLWANDGVREIFFLRSKILASIRRDLDSQGFVEVETPVLQAVASGAHARPFVTHYNALDMPVYLRIATELALKRCVIGGIERVYELGRDFRNEGISPRHNPEFTMLECYAAYQDYTDMMGLTERLVAGAALAVRGTTEVSYQGRPLDLTPPWPRMAMTEAIEKVTGLPVELAMGAEELERRAALLGVEVKPGWGPGKILGEIYEKTTEAALSGPVFICDHPEEISPLTRRHRSKLGYVERFEPVVVGRELGDAYSELVDPVEQRERFLAQAAARAAGDDEAMSIDEEFLRALEYGMPPTGGLGLGIDRLVMLLADVANIREVLLFPMLRAAPRETPDAVEDRAQEPGSP